MAIIYDKEVWLNSPLSLARFTGGCVINNRQFKIIKGGYLVRDDFVGVVNKLGVDTVSRALHKYPQPWKARAVCQRLARIKAVRVSKQQIVLFES